MLMTMEEFLKSDQFKDGMFASELSRQTSICEVQNLQSQRFIKITHSGRVYLTTKGKIAKKIRMKNYMRTERTEKEILEQEIMDIRSENRGLILVFGGLFISLLFIVGFWILKLDYL